MFVLVGLDCILIWWPASARAGVCDGCARRRRCHMASTRGAVGVLRAFERQAVARLRAGVACGARGVVVGQGSATVGIERPSAGDR